MEAKEVLHIMRGSVPAATLEDAEAFLGICHERGLTPFTEASPIVVDYTDRSGKHVHSLSVKEHYAVAERWAQQCGGYTVRERKVYRNDAGDIIAHIGIVSNRDYVDVGKFCTRVGADFKEELAGFVVSGDAVVTAGEMAKRQPPKGKTWEWLAEKRAREAAVLQKFGREPTQSRQAYTEAIAASARAVDAREVQALLYGGEPPAALPAPQRRPAPAADVEPDVEPDEEPVPDPEAPADEPEAPVAPEAPAATPAAAVARPQTLSEARAEWSRVWNRAKRAGLKPPLLDGKWGIEEILEHSAILEAEVEAAEGEKNAA